MKKILNNFKGFSLFDAFIGVAICGIVSFIVLQITREGVNQVSSEDYRLGQALLLRKISKALEDNSSCNSLFTTGTAPGIQISRNAPVGKKAWVCSLEVKGRGTNRAEFAFEICSVKTSTLKRSIYVQTENNKCLNIQKQMEKTIYRETCRKIYGNPDCHFLGCKFGGIVQGDRVSSKRKCPKGFKSYQAGIQIKRTRGAKIQRSKRYVCMACPKGIPSQNK